MRYLSTSSLGKQHYSEQRLFSVNLLPCFSLLLSSLSSLSLLWAQTQETLLTWSSSQDMVKYILTGATGGLGSQVFEHLIRLVPGKPLELQFRFLLC